MTGIEPQVRSDRREHPPSLRQWLTPRIPGSRLMGWLGPLFVTLIAGVLRFYELGKPRAVIFDETYYAKDAWALLHFGYEHNTVKNADQLLVQNPPNLHIWSPGGSFIAHPPAGKWLIATGEWIFGMNPFGWRFAGALIGTLSVLIMARVARRMKVARSASGEGLMPLASSCCSTKASMGSRTQAFCLTAGTAGSFTG